MWIDIVYISLATLLLFYLYRRYGIADTLEQVDPEEEEARQAEQVKKPHKKGWKKERQKEERRAMKELERSERQERQYLKQQGTEQERLEKRTIQQLQKDQKEASEREIREWQGRFEITGQGVARLSESQQKILRQAHKRSLLDTFQHQKYIFLGQLSATFQCKVNQIIEMIQQLEKEGQIVGVFDDRGRYLRLQVQEIEALKRYIVQKGSFSREQFLRQCESTIKLQNNLQKALQTQITAKIQAQQSNIRAEERADY